MGCDRDFTPRGVWMGGEWLSATAALKPEATRIGRLSPLSFSVPLSRTPWVLVLRPFLSFLCSYSYSMIE